MNIRGRTVPRKPSGWRDAIEYPLYSMFRTLSTHVLKRIPAMMIAALTLSSCAVNLVSSYDPVTDRAVQELVGKTETVIADATVSGSSYQRHARFYTEAQGDIGAIEMRSSLYRNNEAEIATLGRLRKAMKNMESIHKLSGSLRPAETEGVRSLLRSLIHHQLSKKRSSRILNEPIAEPS